MLLTSFAWWNGAIFFFLLYTNPPLFNLTVSFLNHVSSLDTVQLKFFKKKINLPNPNLSYLLIIGSFINTKNEVCNHRNHY